MLFLRFAKFEEMLAKGIVDPNKLPPTKDAVHQHIRRVHLQTAIWKALDNSALAPDQWGWRYDENGESPIQSTLDCASADLLNFI